MVRPLAARFLFRDVRTDRDLTADVAVSIEARHLFRTTITLSLTGREKLGKTAADLARGDSERMEARDVCRRRGRARS